jgi:phospholipid-binding lipoprotein MlaA
MRSQQFNDEATRNALTVTRVLDVRTGLLQTVDVVKAAALDPYSFVRDGYPAKTTQRYSRRQSALQF